MIDRRTRPGYTLIELMMVLVFLEMMVLNVPEVYRVVARRERAHDRSMDATALRTSLARRVRVDLDAALSCHAYSGGFALRLPAGWIVYLSAPGGLVRSDTAGVHVWPLVSLSGPPALEARPRGTLLTVGLTAAGAPLTLSRLWAEVAR